MTEITTLSGEELAMEVARMLGIMEREASMPSEGEGAVEKVTAAILSADTLEDILDAAELGGTPVEDLIDVPLMLEKVEWMKSTMEVKEGVQASPFYAILTFKDLITHEEITSTCGARSIVVQAYKLQTGDKLPAPLQIKRKTAVGSGNDFFYFGKLSKANQRYLPKTVIEEF